MSSIKKGVCMYVERASVFEIYIGLDSQPTYYIILEDIEIYKIKNKSKK